MQNNPLYIQSFTEADDALKLHHIVHCSLDVIDERGLFFLSPHLLSSSICLVLCLDCTRIQGAVFRGLGFHMWENSELRLLFDGEFSDLLGKTLTLDLVEGNYN